MEKEDKKNVKKYSNYFITINPNISIDLGDPNFKKYYNVLKSIADEIFEKQNIHNFVIIKKKKDSFNKEVIQKVNINYTIEYGSEMHYLHIHALLEIKHFTLLKLNYDKIRSLVKDKLVQENFINISNEIHLDVQLIRSTNRKTILDYIKKN